MDHEPAAIAERLARVASRLADRTAVVERDARLTYGALDARADAIAARIQAAQGAARGFVALLFEDKIPAIESIFGAARSGRAYVPLDAGDPDDRLRLIVRDSDPAVLLTARGQLGRARALVPAACTVIALEDIGPAPAAMARPGVDPDTLANLYYTSGSTGQPKGVSQTHRNVTFFADAYARTLSIGEADRVSLLYTMSFSASMMDVFGALFNGATLCAYDVRRDGVAALAEWLDRERIGVLHAVPTVFRGLLAGLDPARRLERLRAVDLGGETVFESDVELLRRHARPECVLVNHLAATEANVIAQYVVRHDDPHAGGGILPVGRSPQGVSVRVLREDGTGAAVDEVGDLVVESAHLSPGYWRRPDLDAAAFPPAPPGAARRYAAGDLARIDGEGNLHFLGRKGSRVKIRGQSIDLSEVEAALAACPEVEKSAVIASRDEGNPEADRLVAYLVAAPGAQRDPLAVRRRIAKRLPSYMLPGAYVFLDALPLTATGKIDRQRLVAIEPPRIDPSRNVVPPAGELEKTIASMFEQLLQQTPIGRDDDFFLLGGDSLSAVELQSRVLDRFGVSLAKFYEDATVAGIAARIERSRTAAADSIPVLLPIRQPGSLPPLLLVHGRLGQAFISPHFLGLLPDDLPVWAFQARGLDGLGEPHATIEAMAADYLSEIRQRRFAGPYFLAALCAGALIAVVMARALRAAGERVLPLLLFDPPEQRVLGSLREWDLLFRIRSRKSEGRFVTPIDDPKYATAAVRTARALEEAIWKHEPEPYDGPVYMLSSRQRMASAQQEYLKRIFTGPVERIEVGTTHDDALDPRNPAFVEQLARCLEQILAGADMPAAAGERKASPARPAAT
ncbi:MAG TPA: AMP-binding protein [Casimicrobiaceae bacterium]|nr:AMP-binding protein [Casimicrobiaceae bacterium]